MKTLNKLVKLIRLTARFSSKKYWNDRYTTGENSGPGSYEHLAVFKAEIINKFISEKLVQSVIEFGCGDGNQLLLANYSSYIGIDISEMAINICKNKFSSDQSKKFILLKEFKEQRAELALSLDVIFHLVEDKVFDEYMKRLFQSADKFVIIYASNTDELASPAMHVKHRKFTDWIEKNEKSWALVEKILNIYPYNGDYFNTSFCDFYIYKKLI